ncbi:MAG: methyltransferase domain-containing protein [Acidobacteriota bacterium]|nr:MAG: methyltransferase domain-containing protein [Acidobacteriota bacterium]
MNQRAVGRFYDRCAGFYDFIFDQVFHEGRLEAVKAMRLAPGDSVLEIGIGTGLSLPLYPRHVRVAGIDLSTPMLEEARKRNSRSGQRRSVGLARMNAEKLAFPDVCFDVVYAPHVVSVVPDPRHVVTEMGRVCKPDGRVVVVNHFGTRHPIGRWLERRLTPLTHHVGFRLDLQLDTILGIPGLELVDDRRVNMLKLTRLIVFRKRQQANIGKLSRRERARHCTQRRAQWSAGRVDPAADVDTEACGGLAAVEESPSGGERSAF